MNRRPLPLDQFWQRALANEQLAFAGFGKVNPPGLYPPIDNPRAESGYRRRLIRREHLHLIATLGTPGERHCLMAADDKYLIKFNDYLCSFPFHPASGIGLYWKRAFIKISAHQNLLTKSTPAHFVAEDSSAGCGKSLQGPYKVLTRF